MTSSTCIRESKPHGRVYVVGNVNHYDELGKEDNHEITHPIPLEHLRDELITEVAAGKHHSLAINKEGKILGWGSNKYGAVGVGENKDEAACIPTLIDHTSMCYIQFSKVACGDTFSMALSTKNQIYTWGTFTSSKSKQITGYLPHLRIQYYPRIVNPIAHENIVEIAAGKLHCLALSDKGAVFSWGCNEQGQLGRWTSNMKYDALKPGRVEGLPYITHIFSGAYHSFAIDEHGRLYAWGLNHLEQCGLFSPGDPNASAYEYCEYIPTPRPVPYFYSNIVKVEENLNEKKVLLGEEIQVEDENTRAIDNNSYVDRRLEDQFNMIRKIRPPATSKMETIEPSTIIRSCTYATIKSISAGDAFTIVSTEDNKLVVFGQCDRGQLGITTFPDDYYRLDHQSCAIKFPTVSNWKCQEHVAKVVSGGNHTLVLTEEGVVYGFGRSTCHQLGIYSEEDIYIPTLLQSLSYVGKVIGASASDHHSLFIVSS